MADLVTWEPYYPAGWHNEEEPNLTTSINKDALNNTDAGISALVNAVNNDLVVGPGTVSSDANGMPILKVGV